MSNTNFDVTETLKELDSIGNVSATRKTTKSLFVYLLDKLKNQQNTINEQKKQIHELLTSNNDLIAKMTELQRDQNAKFEQLQAENSKILTQNSNMLDIIHKQINSNSNGHDNDTETRRSVVFYRVPESSDPLPSIRSQSDKEMVINFINSLNVEASVDKCYRMGTQQPGKDRLIKVVLCSSSQQRQLIKSARQTPGSKFYVRPSLSKEERAHQQEKRKTIQLLKIQHPDTKFVLYRNEICISCGNPNQKPKLYDGPLPTSSSQ